MSHRRFPLSLLTLFVLLAAGAPARAGGTVQFELVGSAQGSALVFQQWAQDLGRAGIRDVRIRSGDASAKPGIETQGTAQNPIYIVTGVIASRDEIVLPTGRFRRSDLGRLAAWLRDLARQGPAAATAEKSPLGLSAADFNRIRKDFATPVGFATQGKPRREVVEKIAGRLTLPLRLDAEVARSLADGKVEDELTDLTCGTALACVLRAAGYSLTARAADGEVLYTAVKAGDRAPDARVANFSLAALKAWPTGWISDKPDRDAVPALFEFRNINVENETAAKVIEAIGKRLRVPMILDRKALAQHAVDPGKAIVSYPRRRTTYGQALSRLLFQSGLRFEVRYDEAGTPFVWITTLKPAP
jgi:hypothetical protein